MEEYINKDICKECGGVCCMKNGCMYLPEDFESMEYEYLYNLINKGNISINLSIFSIHGTLKLCNKFNITDITPSNQDLWSFYLFLKVRNIHSDIIDFTDKKSPCIMLTEKGCAYNDNERPTYGLSLVPKKNEKCIQIANKYSLEVMYDWIKHQDVLNKLIFNISNKNTMDLFKEATLENEVLKLFYDNFSHYINPYDGIKAEYNYINKKIDEKINVKKLILKPKNIEFKN